MSNTTVISALDMPEGEYAIVEALGHRTLVGRVAEVERFGTKMLQVEPLFDTVMLGPVLLGGSSIYQFTPCSADVAFQRRPRQDYELPASVFATVPALALPTNDEGGDMFHVPAFLQEDETEVVEECEHAAIAWNDREKFEYCCDCGEVVSRG